MPKKQARFDTESTGSGLGQARAQQGRAAPAREFETLQPSTQEMLRGTETTDVEFKESTSVLESRDLTAFANSPEGGVILIGVREIKQKGRPERGEIIGCEVDNAARMKVYGKALNTQPSVEVVVTVENSAAKPILRVDIPSGKEKPYATQPGEYVTRGDGHRQALHPQRLLNFFVELEGERFLEKFEKATERLQTFIDNVEGTLASRSIGSRRQSIAPRAYRTTPWECSMMLTVH